MTMSPEEMVADAARRCGVPEEELRSYSFPKMFGSAAGTAGDPRDDEPPEPPPPPTLSAGQFRASLPTFRRRPGRHPLTRWLQRKHGGGRR